LEDDDGLGREGGDGSAEGGEGEGVEEGSSREGNAFKVEEGEDFRVVR
jgi:hypothetical protein